MNRDTNDRGVVLANLEQPARTHKEYPELALRDCKPCPVRYSGGWREMRQSREETWDPASDSAMAGNGNDTTANSVAASTSRRSGLCACVYV